MEYKFRRPRIRLSRTACFPLKSKISLVVNRICTRYYNTTLLRSSDELYKSAKNAFLSVWFFFFQRLFSINASSLSRKTAIACILLIVISRCTAFVSAASPSCVLPKARNNQYVVECEEKDSFNYEHDVSVSKKLISDGEAPNFCAVTVKCKKGFSLDANSQNSSVCYRGNWTPKIPECKSMYLLGRCNGFRCT